MFSPIMAYNYQRLYKVLYPYQGFQGLLGSISGGIGKNARKRGKKGSKIEVRWQKKERLIFFESLSNWEGKILIFLEHLQHCNKQSIATLPPSF